MSAPVLFDLALEIDQVGGIERVGRVIGEGPVEFFEEDVHRERQSLEDLGNHEAAHAIGGIGHDLEWAQPRDIDERVHVRDPFVHEVARRQRREVARSLVP